MCFLSTDAILFMLESILLNKNICEQLLSFAVHLGNNESNQWKLYELTGFKNLKHTCNTSFYSSFSFPLLLFACISSGGGIWWKFWCGCFKHCAIYRFTASNNPSKKSLQGSHLFLWDLKLHSEYHAFLLTQCSCVWILSRRVCFKLPGQPCLKSVPGNVLVSYRGQHDYDHITH